MVTRINGFSGMDIDSMVKSMMATKRVPLEKLNQEKQILQWTREGYRELNSVLYDFRTNKLNDKYKKSEALNSNKAVTTGNTNAVKADATATATGVDMKVSVTKLATTTTLSTPGLGQGVPSTTSLAQLDGVALSELSEEEEAAYLKKGFDITINGVSFKDSAGNSLFNGLTSISSMIATINANEKANAIASYDEITGKLSIASKVGGDAGKVEVVTPAGSNSLIALFSKKTVVETNGAGGAVTNDKTLADLQKLLDGKDPEPGAPVKRYNFSINGQNFSFDASTTIDSVLSAINAKPDVNVTATVVAGKLTITGDSGGEVKMGGASYEFLNLFKGAVPFTEGANAIKEVIKGENAEVSINGEPIKNVTSNVFTINGVQLTLLDVTNSSGTDIPTNIKTQSDPDKALESIKGFIDDYNNLIKALNSKINETRYRDFKPLSDDQKKEMKEGEIDSWTEKAKSGLFKNNDIITSVLSKMREAITEKLGSLNAIGITTGNYMENGKLVIADESKLKKAISANPQLAIDLFQGPANGSGSGIFNKMTSSITGALDMISARAGTNKFSMDLTSTFKEESVMGKQLKGFNSRILVMQRNLQMTEDRYYKQFAAMEASMSKLQTQSSSLMSSLGLS
ncbi:flagellar filament capping protein FliD [Paenibacillus polysaccharolyticus]|uniref:flagellar filament capping protein FliD n=1 Tax=Paenibacillus polysaccharolyticus TaxID=582692 RepID=UPI00300A2544